MSDVIWEDPRRQTWRRWVDELRPLVDHPGRWARIAEFDVSKRTRASEAARMIREATFPEYFPAGARFDAVSRTVDRKVTYLYARYIGRDGISA